MDSVNYTEKKLTCTIFGVAVSILHALYMYMSAVKIWQSAISVKTVNDSKMDTVAI